MFEEQMVMDQLRYSGMLETIRIRRSGYPIRLTFKVFLDRYYITAYMVSFPYIHTQANLLLYRYGLIASLTASTKESVDVIKEKCVNVLNSSKVDPSGFQIGITKVLSV